jgi:hypothetical protein
MNPENRTYAYFSLIEPDFDPAEITRRLGIEPSDSWRKGDPHPKIFGAYRKFSRWSLKSRLPASANLKDHVVDVLDQMDAKKESFCSVLSEFKGELQLVGYFELHYPGFGLPASSTERIGFYRLSLDCDFYYLYSNEREDTDHHS